MSLVLAILSFLYAAVTFANKVWPTRNESQQSDIDKQRAIADAAIRNWVREPDKSKPDANG